MSIFSSSPPPCFLHTWCHRTPAFFGVFCRVWGDAPLLAKLVTTSPSAFHLPNLCSHFKICLVFLPGHLFFVHLYLFYSSTGMFSWNFGRESLRSAMLNQKSFLTIWISHLPCRNLQAWSPQSTLAFPGLIEVKDSDLGSGRYWMCVLGLTDSPPWASFPPVKIRDRGFCVLMFCGVFW